MQQLGGAGGVGIHVAAHIQPLPPGALHQGQRPGYLRPPVLPAHGLQMADMHGHAQRPGHRQHLLHGLAHAAALLPHVDGQRDVLPRQGLQRADQLLRGVKALRRVAQSQGHAQRTVGQRLLQRPVYGPVVPVLQMLQLIARRVGPQHPRAGQHPHVQGQRRQ